MFFDSKWEQKWRRIIASDKGCFIVKVEGGLDYEVDMIKIIIKNSTTIQQATIDENYEKLELIFKLLGCNTDSLSSMFDAAVKADKEYREQLDSNGINISVNVSTWRHYTDIVVKPKRNYKGRTEFVPYKP